MSLPDVIRMRSLHRRLRLEALEVAIDGSDGERAAVAHIAHDAVALRDVAVDCYLVPPFGVSDVVDRNVVVLAPEERDRIDVDGEAAARDVSARFMRGDKLLALATIFRDQDSLVTEIEMERSVS